MMKRGYILIEVMIALVIAGVIATVFTTMNYYTHIQANIMKHQNTKTILDVIRSRLLILAQDPDSDSYFELLKEEDNNSVPASVDIGTDAWAKRIYYYTIDLGTSDGTNAPYADTNDSISPNANIAGRLISSGENLTLETNASDATAQGDDLMLEIGVGEINHYKLYGSSEIATETRGYNSAIVSATEPTTPYNGTLWFDTTVSKLKIYHESNTSWDNLN